jgi:DNA-binding MarR family transcriptional regulator
VTQPTSDPAASVGAMPVRASLATLLSQVLVAFTIEFDNEFERRMPHRTSRGPATGGREVPWLVSMAMWSNFLSHLEPSGAPLSEVDDLVRMTNLGGLLRWGYLTVTPDKVVRPTEAGQRAQQIWRPLADEIEQRWRDRFGDRLRSALRDLTSQFEQPLPRYLPVMNFGNGMRTLVPDVPRDSPDDLSVLLSHALIAYTLVFERESDVSLPISANVLRILDGTGVLVRDLPGRSGVSKEAIAAAVGFLERHGHVTLSPAGRGKSVVLTSTGQRAQDTYHRLGTEIEQHWRDQFGADTIDELLAALKPPAGAPPAPYPDGWRATVRRPTPLPHHPMVLHRGGFPDGS